MTKEDLIDRVTARTHGTAGDPLTREEVAQVVDATLAELATGELPDEDDTKVEAEDGDDSVHADGEAEQHPA